MYCELPVDVYDTDGDASDFTSQIPAFVFLALCSLPVCLMFESESTRVCAV